jgi:hypothetical protein
MGDKLDLTGLFSWPYNLPKSYLFFLYSRLHFSLGRGQGALSCPRLREFRVSP